ncbi:MAG: hypothetical protein M3065_12750 [Actinomycetota bacterium]|nr:hypothetical protein [Actinomycetota bacterium]
MGRGDLIDCYLDELDRELCLPRRLRRRIIAEAREHLRESISQTAAPDAATQMLAIQAFGTPAEVATAFAREVAIGSTRRAARRGGVLFVLSLALWDLCTSSFIHVAPGWINDGPGSALLWIIGQVGLVAGIVSLARARVARRTDTVDTARLRYAVRGLLVLAVCSAITVSLAATGVAVALTGPATRHGQLLLAGLILACAAITIASSATVWQAHRRLGALEHLPLTATGREALSDVVSTVSDGLAWAGRRVPVAGSIVRGISSSWAPAARRALSPFDPHEHPWRYGCSIALLAGTAVPILDVVVLMITGQLDGPRMRDLAAIAPALMAIETGLVISGYASLGRYLGLRPPRRSDSRQFIARSHRP